LDAGQIAIESKLADKKALREVQEKRHSQYNEEDYERLEALMYDSFSVKLKDAQVSDSRLPCSFFHVQIAETFLVCTGCQSRPLS
jgi:hypothetical protein